MSTPHNNAKPGDFAKTVLMPGADRLGTSRIVKAVKAMEKGE